MESTKLPKDERYRTNKQPHSYSAPFFCVRCNTVFFSVPSVFSIGLTTNARLAFMSKNGTKVWTLNRLINGSSSIGCVFSRLPAILSTDAAFFALGPGLCVCGSVNECEWSGINYYIQIKEGFQQWPVSLCRINGTSSKVGLGHFG